MSELSLFYSDCYIYACCRLESETWTQMRNVMSVEAWTYMNREIRMSHKRRQQNGKGQLKSQMQGGKIMLSTNPISALEVKDP